MATPLPKRIVHLAKKGDHCVMDLMLDFMVEDGRIVYVNYEEIPVLDNVDGVIAFGHGAPDHDSFQAGLVAALQGKPCIYLYMMEKPSIPGVVTLEIPCSYTELLEFFDSTIGKGGGA